MYEARFRIHADQPSGTISFNLKQASPPAAREA